MQQKKALYIQMSAIFRKQRLLPKLVLAGVIPLLSSHAQALSFTPSPGLQVEWDTSLSYAAAWRLENQDSFFLANVNGDDGNRNFDKGLISNRISVITEADFNYKNVGAFVRGAAYYDDEYQGVNDNDSPATSNNVSVPFNEFTSDTKKLHGDDVELLDAFIYGEFDLGGHRLNLRLGDQVVSWGESLFVLQGISSTQGPLDDSKSNVPGVELKELFRPVGQVYGQFDLTDTLSAEGYYQYKWEEHRLDAAGSYFSRNDPIDEGGESLIVAPGMALARGQDSDASDSGQWGVALRYLAEDLNDTEFGLYYLNFHSKLPQLVLDIPGGSYHLDYVEDIQLLGASFGTVVGDTNVSGEISFRDDQPVAVGGPGTPPVLTNTWQTQVSVLHLFGPSALADSVQLLGEAGYNRVNGLDGADLANDKGAWGYSAKAVFAYNNIFPGIDLAVPVAFSQGVNGNSSIVNTFTEGKDKFSVATEFTYMQNLKASLGYTAFLGDPDENDLADRDFISFSLKYGF